MSVSDLTGTKWVFKSSPTLPEYGVYAINFVSNGNNYTQITLTNDAPLIDIHYNSTGAYGGFTPSWTNQAYRIISITGGTDATNSTLIQWLQANATQVDVVDLAGTSWVIDDEPTIDISKDFSINFTSNNENFIQLTTDEFTGIKYTDDNYMEIPVYIIGGSN